MGATPGLADELAKDYGPNVAVTEDPAVGTPEGSPSTATPQQDPASPPAGEGEKPAEGAPSAEGTPGEPQPAGQVPPAEASSEELEEDPAAAQEPAQLTEEQVQSFKDLEERAAEKAVVKIREEEIPAIQRGLDRQVSTFRDANTALQTELDEANKLIREESIKGLSEDDAAQMRTGWASEDKLKELDKYSDELDGWHLALAARDLLSAYSQYGVTAEDFEKLDDTEQGDLTVQWTDFCKDRKIEFLEKNPGQNGTAPTEAAPAKAAQPTPSEASQPPPPAGFKAASDAGGGGVPPAPVEADTGKGVSAMGNNVAGHGWENASFAKPGR